MASQCKRQQCTIDRRGFRQELDSWRHKLIHCVGFESILEGLFGPELVEDLKLFKDLEPTPVSDWSFDENCLFCCLRRDKVKEHLIGLNTEGLEDKPKPLLVKDQIAISRLEKQAEEFLNAVLCRKDVPNFSDPHIPVVAREILQRMIRQFAAEYTSKTSSPQDSCSDFQPHSDQSLQTPPLLSGAPPSTSPAATVAGPAHNQNPVLSKLLMADQDAPLDLTIKKPLAVPSNQDGVLDLSIKKNRFCSSMPARSPCLSPATSMLKGESAELAVSKAKELQSTSTLEQFMAKLCPHHQRQIVDAIGFLQTEVKAFASSSKEQDLNSATRIQGTACSSAKSSKVIPERCHTEITPKSELQEMSSSVPSSCAIENVPEDVVSLKTPVTAGQALDLHSPGSESNQTSITPTSKPIDTEDNRHGDHVPLKMKIVTGKTLSCVLNTSLSSHSDTLEDKEVNSSSRAETPGARLSSSVKRHNHASHTHQTKQRETLGQAKDTPTKLFSVHMTTPPESPRTARKTIRASSDHGISDSACQVLTDPDLGHCDIVFIDRPITDCLKEKQTSKLPRRNARKSTRGHMYSNETWELKTVRTLAGRGNCPNPMPELITLVTPKQILSKPEGVPPVDMPFAAACRDPLNQQRSTQDSTESVIPGTGDIVQVAASDIDIVVETSQTDQCQGKEQSVPPSPVRSPIDNEKTHLNTDVEQSATTDSGITIENKESVAQAPCQAEIPTNREPQEIVPESTDQTLAETPVELSNNITTEEAELEHSPDELVEGDRVHKESSAPSPVNHAEEEKREESKREELQDKQLPKPHPETLMPCDDTEVTKESSTTESSEELIVKEPEVKASEAVDSFIPLGTEDDDDDDNNHDVSSKTLDALLKELPPWRRKKGTVISLPKWLRQSEEVVVGYINGRPISASDRSLRRRSSNTTISPTKTPVKSSQCSSNRISAHSAADANLKKESKNKDLPETPMPAESLEATPVAQQGKETSSSTQLSSKLKLPLRTKLKRALRGQDSLSPVSDQSGDHSQSPESKRQLRSSGPRPADSPVSKPTSDSSTSVPPPVSTAALTLPSTDDLPVPVISPFSSSPSPVFGHSQQNAVPDTNQGLNDEQTEPATTTEDTQETEDESRIQSRVKQSTAKTVADESKPAKIQASDDTSSISEDQSPIKTEMQRESIPLRSKRFLRKEGEATDVALSQKPNAASSGDESASVGDSSRSVSDKPTRMPLRSESSKSDVSNQSTAQSPPVDNKKLALRSQRLAAPSTSTVSVIGSQGPIASPIKLIPEKITKVQMKPPQVSTASAIPNNSAVPFTTQRLEPPKQTPNKFFETLTGEENQHLITNLNVKYDKMHKGWIQMDKEGQPAARYKNKADRQAAIWKSKRRARKTKSLEHQKYSPVQMLFMKGFNLTSICRWFLESTETKSLVIVKKVNTRLPSETQLCFHSSSGASGSSQGVFPSLQAERLKKHLKKFAIASPVKSNPKSQKLIARALELEANKVKGKERKELPSTTQALTKPHSSKAHVQIGESQKSTGKAKNPASARILRKYSNIREKMQAQQTNVRKKEASKTLRTNSIKRLNKAKSASKSDLKPPMKAQKSPLPANKQMKESVAKMERRKPLVGKATAKHIPERTVKAQMSGKASRDATKKELPKRSSQRLLSPKLPEHKPVTASKTKGSSKKQIEEEKAEVVKPSVNKNSVKIQTKESSQAAVSEIKANENTVETPQQSTDVKVPPSPDQILTRSQRKMEAAAPLSGSPSHASKRATKSTKTESASPKPARKAEEATLTRSGAIKSLARRSQGLSLLRSATKSATKRAQELSESPAKRTRTSLSK
ncbi:uncharacterized protein V6R79_021975 [Siganus canaliculatus]